MLPHGWEECQKLWDSGAFSRGYGVARCWGMRQCEVMPLIEWQLKWLREKEGITVSASLPQIWSYLELRWIQAGLRSPEKTKIDQDLEALQMDNKKREAILVEMEDRFCRIVQYARSADLPVRAAAIEEELPDMVAALRDCTDNWQHGFNSGVLAALRLALEVAFGNKADAERAIEDFPFLDT